MKHKHITFATRNQPGYNVPAAPKSKAGGGYPSRQPALHSKKAKK